MENGIVGGRVVVLPTQVHAAEISTNAVLSDFSNDRSLLHPADELRKVHAHVPDLNGSALFCLIKLDAITVVASGKGAMFVYKQNNHVLHTLGGNCLSRYANVARGNKRLRAKKHR